MHWLLEHAIDDLHTYRIECARSRCNNLSRKDLRALKKARVLIEKAEKLVLSVKAYKNTS